MVLQTSSPSWLGATLALLSLFSLLVPANALYFYVDGRQTKCFFEDLPKDTLVAGMSLALSDAGQKMARLVASTTWLITPLFVTIQADSQLK